MLLIFIHAFIPQIVFPVWWIFPCLMALLCITLISLIWHLVCICNCLFILSSFNINCGSCRTSWWRILCFGLHRIFFFSFFILPVFYLYHHISGMIRRLEFMEWTSLLCWSALVTVLAVVAGASLGLGSNIGSQKKMPWNGSRSNMKVWFLTSPRIPLRPGRFLGRCYKFWARLMLCRPKILYYYPCFLSIGRAWGMLSGPKSVNLFLLYIFLAALI